MMNNDTYLKNYHQKKYFPKTTEELKEYVDFEIEKQGGINVDLNMIDTRYITEMQCIFSLCSSLQTLDVNGWDMSNVRDMHGMFSECSSLQSINAIGWDTSKVECMNFMFSGCSSLQSINVSGWDTSKVRDMGWMFKGCRKLKADISMWKSISKYVTSHMLQGTRNIICTWDNANELR